MTNPNDPTFPVRNYGVEMAEKGITKREYFAGLAMQGLLMSAFKDGGFSCDYESISMSALSATDALIAELSKEPSK